MKAAITILQKVVVNHFYRVNAGLFMFLFYVLFGMPQNAGDFHIALATVIVASPLFLCIVFLIWLLYNLKCIDYTSRQLKEPGQVFLYSLECAGAGKVYMYLVFVQCMMYLPVTAYAIFLIIIAAKNNIYTTMAAIIVYMPLMIFSPSLFYKRVLQRRVAILNITAPAFLRLPKPYFLIPVFYILKNRKQMLLITKFFSLGLLWLFISKFNPDHYDIRPMLFCCLLAAVANSTIVFEIRSFEETYLPAARNLPFSLSRRFFYILLMYAMLLLPELLFIWKGYPLYFNSIDYPQVLLTSIALLCLLHTSLLMERITMEVFIKIVFGIAMALFFVILYNPGISLSLCMFIISFAMFHAYYYDFEK